MRRYATRALYNRIDGDHSGIFQVLLELCREANIPEDVLETAVKVQAGSPANITCDHCEARILDSDMHYHCDICYFGDFDLCQRCVQEGKSCFYEPHQLVGRCYTTLAPLKKS
jgi:Zn finger protein HypA/HybF involved in hydrogenase expression